jgi:hypothetical protein
MMELYVSRVVPNLEMSNKGELLITDKKEVIVNFKIPSRNKHGRTDRYLVDSSSEIRTGYPSIHPLMFIIKRGTCVKFWILISRIVVNEGSSLLVLE